MYMGLCPRPSLWEKTQNRAIFSRWPYRLDNPCYPFFFFSSRRRHTRYWRDWSSDVCSSDLGHNHRAALRAHDDLVLGALEIVHVHQALVLARGKERRFVDEVGEVGAREARRPEIGRASCRERV